MTAVSSSLTSTLSKVGGCRAMAWPRVSVPSIGESAAGSTVIMKNVLARPPPSGLLEARRAPPAPIGSSSVPWKQK